VPNTVNTVSAVFNVETHSTQFEDARVVLSSTGHDVRQGNPSAATINRQAKDSNALSFGVRRTRNLLYRIAICSIVSQFKCGPVGASRFQRLLSGLPFPSSYAVAPTARGSGFGALRTRWRFQRSKLFLLINQRPSAFLRAFSRPMRINRFKTFGCVS
jgi:hypothetical protein